MKILAVGSHVLPNPKMQSQVDHWRIGRPMRELARHTDWQIDHSPTFIVGFEEHAHKKQFTKEEMELAFKRLSDYDIIFSSYHPDPTAYTMLKVAKARHGTDLVMDCDDDMFAINPDNPFWLKMDDEKVYWMQRMIADNDWITTPSPVLAERFRDRRPDHTHDTVTVIPNYLPDDYQHPSFNNGDDIIIGYMGGSSHYADLHESGVLPALLKLMHEDKRVRFHSYGMYTDTYLPRARYKFHEGKRGTAFLEQIFPKLHFDIALAPLLDNIFNLGKSNIKWQEMTRAGAALVASNVGPYASLRNGETALLVENDPDAWYTALKTLVDSPAIRGTLVANARRELRQSWRLENHWQAYKELFERVKGVPSANHQTRPPATILQT